MKKIKDLIQDYFGFPPKETRGFTVLMFLILFLLILPSIVKSFISMDDSKIEDEKKLDEVAAQLDTTQTSLPHIVSAPAVSESGELFFFNPNIASKEELIRLGIEEKMASRILNYRNKGGRFLIKNDIKKIYGLPETTFTRLYPFIDLPENKSERKEFAHSKTAIPPNTNKPYFNKDSRTLKAFDINKADTSQLIAIRGVGSKLASRIISFRDKLGGFVTEEQFKEVYGLDTAVVKKLGETTFISPDFKSTKIHINSASFDDLKQHPYIGYKLAKTIISYRDQHGSFISLTDLKKIHTVNSQTYIKIEPYLDLQ